MANLRYKELKFEGKTYTKKYQIDEILLENGFNWFLDAEIENARIEIMKETLIFNAGIWYNGVWEYGVIRDIDWRAGTFKNGVIYNGIFKRVTVERGIIFNGTFLKGDILFADIRGGEFKDVNISKNVNQTEKTQQPETQIQTQIQGEPTIQTQGKIHGQTGQKIQTQIEEKYNPRVMKYGKFINELFLGGKLNENDNPNLIVVDNGDRYIINKMNLERKLYRFFRENNKIEEGHNNNEILITYEYEASGTNNPKDIADAMEYLENLPGVETVIHRMGFYFEITFDKQVEIK
ncbi:MAG: hypothetical protein HPY57_16015 [Ignavibacteria bacterium]|nr:hypothetical protein [Ignavibacteria bacterium]